MGRQAILASCSLAQWALDLEGNLVRIKRSIHEAKAKGATLRTGPQLEVMKAVFTVFTDANYV